ncbi:MAG TPA: MBL fold metallo-hydrolase [Ktedonobacteraceae bacterium]|nr:MBL fold metallo-hydrolase [Ktedonobacteraceae bacterium]
MSPIEGITYVPELSSDSRVRVFRSFFAAEGEFDSMQVDAYVVITDRYVVVLDTLLRPEDAAAMMQEEGVRNALAGRQALVVNSHADWDHSWGNAYFTAEHASPILAQDYCRIRMLSDEAKAELADYQQRYPLFSSVKLVPPTLTFHRTFTIHGGDLTIQLLPAPGHHADHIAAWIPELRLLLAFDAVEKPLPTLEDATGVQPMFDTLQRFLTLQPQRVLCSHGNSSEPALVNANLAYLREIERRSRALLSHHTLTSAELDHPSQLIGYLFDELVPPEEDVDRTFYTWAHDHNIRSIIEWLMQAGSPSID